MADYRFFNTSNCLDIFERTIPNIFELTIPKALVLMIFLCKSARIIETEKSSLKYIPCAVFVFLE